MRTASLLALSILPSASLAEGAVLGADRVAAMIHDLCLNDIETPARVIEARATADYGFDKLSEADGVLTLRQPDGATLTWVTGVGDETQCSLDVMTFPMTETDDLISSVTDMAANGGLPEKADTAFSQTWWFHTGPDDQGDGYDISLSFDEPGRVYVATQRSNPSSWDQ